MKTPFYNSYLYKFPNNTTYEMIERNLQKLGSEVSISIRDISENTNEERIHIIDGMITAERIRMYEPGKQKECYVHVVKYAENRFLVIISIYPESNTYRNSKSVFQAVCGTNDVSYIDSGAAKDGCEKYWFEYIREFVHVGRYLHKENYNLDAEEMFPIEFEGVSEIKAMFGSFPMRAKALLTCAFARVACAGVRNDSVIIEDHICNGKLNRMPVRICDLTSELPINDAVDAFSHALRNGNITYEDVTTLSKVNLDEYILYSQTVLYDKMYEKIFKNAVSGTLYKFDALAIPNIPLFLVFHMDGDMASVQYYYDSAYFRKISIEGLHEAFCATLSKLLKKDYTVTDYKPYLREVESNDSKRIDAVAGCLKKSGWFDAYSENELIRLAKLCKVKRIFFGQNFIDSGTENDQVYLLVHGKVEVVGRDRSNVLHSLRLIKEMNFFGFEAISDQKTATEDYQAMTDDVLAVAIDADLFLQEAGKHNELFVKAITLQNTNIVKYQKLWMMS